MSSIRLQIKDSIIHYLCDDWNNHKRGRAHKENQAIFDRKDGYACWCNTDLEMVMEKVVKGIYATDFETYEKQIRADALSIDMDKPMHFTDEQKAWVKNYIIINAKRQRADAIDEFYAKCKEKYWFSSDFMNYFDEVREQLKSQN